MFPQVSRSAGVSCCRAQLGLADAPKAGALTKLRYIPAYVTLTCMNADTSDPDQAGTTRKADMLTNWPLASPEQAAALEDAVELGAEALWHNRNRNALGPASPGPDYADRLMARVVLGAAAPAVAALERQRIRQGSIRRANDGWPYYSTPADLLDSFDG